MISLSIKDLFGGGMMEIVNERVLLKVKFETDFLEDSVKEAIEIVQAVITNCFEGQGEIKNVSEGCIEILANIDTSSLCKYLTGGVVFLLGISVSSVIKGFFSKIGSECYEKLKFSKKTISQKGKQMETENSILKQRNIPEAISDTDNDQGFSVNLDEVNKKMIHLIGSTIEQCRGYKYLEGVDSVECSLIIESSAQGTISLTSKYFEKKISSNYSYCPTGKKEESIYTLIQ